MKKHAVIALLMLVCLGEQLHGQQKTGYIEGSIRIVKEQTVIIPDDQGLSDGAAVQLVIAGDTLYTVTFNGKFYFDKIPTGAGSLTVTHLSFQMVTQEVTVTARTRISIYLTEKENVLNEARVTGRIPLMTTSGDTLRINAEAVKLMEGDLALEILKQIPGAIISESGITI